MANERKYTGFPSDEYFVLFGARERLGNQWRSPIPISEIIDTGKEVSPISNFLKSIEPRSDYVTAALSRIVDAEAGLTPSRPAACALFILKFISQDFERRAWQAYQDLEDDGVIFWFDIAYGVHDTVSRVLRAEAAIKGQNEKYLVEGISYAEGYALTTSPSKRAEQYLAILNEDEEDARLLQEDPSGSSLIDNTVSRLKEYKPETTVVPLLSKYQIREFVIAGAELAQAAYRLIYPFSERIPN